MEGEKILLSQRQLRKRLMGSIFLAIVVEHWNFAKLRGDKWKIEYYLSFKTFSFSVLLSLKRMSLFMLTG